MQGLEDMTWDRLAITLTVCSLASSSVTQVVRAFVKPRLKKAPLRRAVLRLCAVLIGGGAGALVGGWPAGAVIGVASGGLTTTAVAAVKARIGGASTQPPEDIDF